MIELVALELVDEHAVEQLLDRAFGPDRRARTAYHIRTGMQPLPKLSLAAVDGDALAGTIQCWPVTFNADDGAAIPMIMVGPVAVAPDRQQGGLGRRLMTASLQAAAQSGCDAALMLIGDPEYYGRFFGFSADRTAQWRVPGPVERHRLLARGTAVPALAGSVGPRVPAAAA